MKWRTFSAGGRPSVGLALSLTAVAAAIAPAVSYARIDIPIEQVQRWMFPEGRLTRVPVVVGEDIQALMRKASGVQYPFSAERIWRSADGGWFIVDEVLGKHEMITYAVGLKADGSVLGIDILRYLESYGEGVADAIWRSQFVGKRAEDPLRLNSEIRNISGATLSCKHVSDGVKRVLAFHRAVLQGFVAR